MLRSVKNLWMVSVLLPVLLAAPMAHSQSSPSAEELAAQISELKSEYEKRITALEAQLATLRSGSGDPDGKTSSPVRASMPASDNSFNPALGVVLNGMYSHHSGDSAGLPGFQLGHESERAVEGLSLGHSELSMSGNIDDKFRGNLTLGLGVHPGEPTELELEEAYIQTLPGSGMPDGIRLKAGRALWTLGYLNELHVHGDDFSDRPLPYRAYLDGAYNDDGVELSVVLPGDVYREIGGGLFRGDDAPFGGSGNGSDAWSAYARLGGDLGRNMAWRIGTFLLDGKAEGRNLSGGHAHGEEEVHGHDEEGHEEEEHAHADFFSEGEFTGDTRLFGADFRFTWAPTGNARDSELILQGEYFRRRESGTYLLQEEHEECVIPAPTDGEDHTHPVCTTHVEDVTEFLDGSSSGWYAQAVYKFLPRWRVGARYSRLHPPSDAELDHNLSMISTMVDWNNSEFGRVRFQYNRESFGSEGDDQFILQYIMSLGAHAAHSF